MYVDKWSSAKNANVGIWKGPLTGASTKQKNSSGWQNKYWALISSHDDVPNIL